MDNAPGTTSPARPAPGGTATGGAPPGASRPAGSPPSTTSGPPSLAVEVRESLLLLVLSLGVTVGLTVGAQALLASVG